MPRVRTAVTMTVKPSDLDEVVGIFQTFIKGVEESDPGTLRYEYFVDDGDPMTIHVSEEYADSEAHLAHYTHLDMQAVGRLVELVTLGTPHFFGDPSPQERELLKGFGDVQYHLPLVSIDQPVPTVRAAPA